VEFVQRRRELLYVMDEVKFHGVLLTVLWRRFQELVLKTVFIQ